MRTLAMSSTKPPVFRTTLAFDKRNLTDNPAKITTATYNGPLDNQAPANTDNSKTSVVTNYVAVSKVPKQVYVYRVEYADIPPPQGPISPANPARPIIQRSQKVKIFKALTYSHNSSPLFGKKDWATDYASVWSLEPLTKDPTNELDKPQCILKDVDYRKQGGRVLRVPQVAFIFERKLVFSHGTLDLARGINKPELAVGMQDLTIGTNITAGPPIPIPNPLTTALNAMLTKHVTSAEHTQLEQVGANKFFIKNTFGPVEAAASDALTHALGGHSVMAYQFGWLPFLRSRCTI